MVTLSLNSAPSALRRPVCELSFGTSPAGDWQRALTWVRIQAGLAPFVDVAEVGLAAGGWEPQVALGDTGTIKLGYEDSGADLVFSGQVQALRHNLDGTLVVTAVNGGGLLSRLRLNQAYEKQKAGDIVRDLAGRAGVSTGNLQSGSDFPYIILDDRRSAYQHIAVLGRKCGFYAYISPDGKLAFGPLTAGQPTQTFAYGADILAIETRQGQALLGSVSAIGEGAAGSQGSDAWSWLIKDPAQVSASAGSGDPQRQAPDAAMRSQSSAQSAADGAQQMAGLYSVIGRLLVPGAPAAVVGGTVQIQDVPSPGLSGACLVRQLQHAYNKNAGFTTHLELSASSGGPGSLGGLL